MIKRIIVNFFCVRKTNQLRIREDFCVDETLKYDVLREIVRVSLFNITRSFFAVCMCKKKKEVKTVIISKAHLHAHRHK